MALLLLLVSHAQVTVLDGSSMLAVAQSIGSRPFAGLLRVA